MADTYNTTYWFEEEYNKQLKRPLCVVKLTKPLPGYKPHIHASGRDYYPEVIDCQINAGLSIGSNSCTITCRRFWDNSGNSVTPEPMDRIVVQQGYTTEESLLTTFYGFVHNVVMVDEPGIYRIVCQDILKLAELNFYAYEDMKVYSALEYTNPDGEVFAAKEFYERTAEKVISTFLEESGIVSGYYNLEFPDPSEEAYPILGATQEVIFQRETALEAIGRICDNIKYSLWADVGGLVRCRINTALPVSESRYMYGSEDSSYDPKEFDYIFPIFFDTDFVSAPSGHLLHVEATTHDEWLRNYIIVRGADYEDGTKRIATVYGDSNYVPVGIYRKLEQHTDLLSTDGMVLDVATRIYHELNRLHYNARADIEGDARIHAGDTVKLTDGFAIPGGREYMLDSYSSQFNGTSWIMSLNLTGGVGTGALPKAYVKPYADFTLKFIRMVGVSADAYEVHLDASNSKTINGEAIVSYLWDIVDYPLDLTGEKAIFYLNAGTLEWVDVTLTITDAEGVTDTLRKRVRGPDASEEIAQKTSDAKARCLGIVYDTNLTQMYATITGGQPWYTHQFSSNISAVRCDHKKTSGYVGLSNGQVYYIPDLTDISAGSREEILSAGAYSVSSIWSDYVYNDMDYHYGTGDDESDRRLLWIARGQILHRIKAGIGYYGSYNAYTFDNTIVKIYGTKRSPDYLIIIEGPNLWWMSKDNLSLQKTLSGSTWVDVCCHNNEIQAIDSSGNFHRSSDLGYTWYTATGEPSGATRVAFNRRNRQHSVLGCDALLGQYNGGYPDFTFINGAIVQGQVYCMDSDYYNDALFIGTDYNLYITYDWGESVVIFRTGGISAMSIGATILEE